MCEETKETNNYCVGCLPTELLEKILSYLCVVDYIYIHTVCKGHCKCHCKCHCYIDTTKSCWEWRKVSLPDECRKTFIEKIVSFVTKGKGQALHLSIHRSRSSSSYEVVLDDHEPPVCSSNSRQQEEVEYDLRMSIREAISKLQNSIQMDSFSTYVWCAMLGNNKFLTWHKWRHFKNRSIELMRQGSIQMDSLNQSDWCAMHRNFQPGDNDEIEFSWHEYPNLPVADRNNDLRDRACFPSSHDSCSAVSWLLPGLVDCSSNLDWSHVGQSS